MVGSHPTEEPRVAVRVTGLEKVFHRRGEQVKVLKGLDISVAQGELLVLLGPSGCGKTTFLRCLAGLERPTAGTIDLDDKVVVDVARGVVASPNRRNVAMVFQNYALWPHMKVKDNVRYPLKARRLRNLDRGGRVNEVLDVVRCGHLANRYPPELSGGQQQRVSLARALAPNPALLLLDEPLSNLDALLRLELRAQLRELHTQLGFTGVYVTHDQEEALALGTRVAVMNEGEIVQLGAPPDVYGYPATEQIADFLGLRNRFALRIDDQVRINDNVVEEFRRFPRGEFGLRIRPSRLQLRRTRQIRTESDAITWLRGAVVTEVLPGIDKVEHIATIGGRRYVSEIAVGAERFDVGEAVDIGLPHRSVRCYDKGGNLVAD